MLGSVFALTTLALSASATINFNCQTAAGTVGSGSVVQLTPCSDRTTALMPCDANTCGPNSDGQVALVKITDQNRSLAGWTITVQPGDIITLTSSTGQLLQPDTVDAMTMVNGMQATVRNACVKPAGLISDAVTWTWERRIPETACRVLLRSRALNTKLGVAGDSGPRTGFNQWKPVVYFPSPDGTPSLTTETWEVTLLNAGSSYGTGSMPLPAGGMANMQQGPFGQANPMPSTVGYDTGAGSGQVAGQMMPQGNAVAAGPPVNPGQAPSPQGQDDDDDDGVMLVL